MEARAIDAPAPYRNLCLSISAGELIGDGQRRRQYAVAPAIKAVEIALDRLAQEGQAIIVRIGFKARVHAGDHGHIILPGVAERLPSKPVGR